MGVYLYIIMYLYRVGPALGPDGNRGAVRLSQLIGLQGQGGSRPANNGKFGELKKSSLIA